MQKDLMFDRRTVTKYLNKIVDLGLLTKMKIGRDNYYINNALFKLFLTYPIQRDKVASIESITE